MYVDRGRRVQEEVDVLRRALGRPGDSPVPRAPAAARDAAARSSRAHATCRRFAPPGGPSGSVGSDGRLPPDPRHGRARRRVRDALVHRVAAARAAAPELGEAGSVRVRDRARAGAGGALSGQVLSGRDELHRARRRDRLPVSVLGRVPRPRRVRPVRDGHLRARVARPVRVPAVGRRARVGTGARTCCNACPGRCCAPATRCTTRTRSRRPSEPRSRRPDGSRPGPAQLRRPRVSKTSCVGAGATRCSRPRSVSRVARSR